MKEAITPPIAKKKIDTFNKTKNHKHPMKQQIQPEAINLTKLNHQINQGLLKEMKQETHQTK